MKERPQAGNEGNYRQASVPTLATFVGCVGIAGGGEASDAADEAPAANGLNAHCVSGEFEQPLRTRIRWPARAQADFGRLRSNPTFGFINCINQADFEGSALIQRHRDNCSVEAL